MRLVLAHVVKVVLERVAVLRVSAAGELAALQADPCATLGSCLLLDLLGGALAPLWARII